MHLSINLKLLRTMRKRSAAEVAAGLDMKRSTYSSWENGGSEPSARQLLILSAYHKLSLDLLLGTDLCTMRPSQIEALQRAYAQPLPTY